MDLMVCMRGESHQLEYLPEITELGSGIELGSYAIIGIQSQKDWDARIALHKAVCEQFNGPLAVHGPFIGIQYWHSDHLLREATQRRLDMMFDVVQELGMGRIVVHSGFVREVDLFNLRTRWLERNIGFWRTEIKRWADVGVSVVIENNIEESPELLVSLASGVDNPALGLCFDIGHQNIFSDVDAVAWVEAMKDHLVHIHLHDNNGTGDQHLPVGEGTIDFNPFYECLKKNVPDVTVSLEIEAGMDVRVANLRTLSAALSS